MADRDSELQRLCSLTDDNRRRLYDHVVAQARPVTRDEAAAALGLDRSLVAYHLDKLVEDGLLATSFARAPGRRGPGAGRPAKRYERADVETAVSLPPRDYELAAELLARAAERDESGAVREALRLAAEEFGRELAPESDAESETTDGLMDFLARRGFEPYEEDGVIRLRNCPFHQLAQRHTELVCGMNLALLSAAVTAVDPQVQARLDPAPGRCCVALSTG